MYYSQCLKSDSWSPWLLKERIAAKLIAKSQINFQYTILLHASELLSLFINQGAVRLITKCYQALRIDMIFNYAQSKRFICLIHVNYHHSMVCICIMYTYVWIGMCIIHGKYVLRGWGGSAGTLFRWLILMVGRDCMDSNPTTDRT